MVFSLLILKKCKKLITYIFLQSLPIIVILICIRIFNKESEIVIKIWKFENKIIYFLIFFALIIALSKIFNYEYNKKILAENINQLERYFWLIYLIAMLHLLSSRLIRNGVDIIFLIGVILPSLATLNKAFIYFSFTSLILLSISFNPFRKIKLIQTSSIFIFLILIFLYLRFGFNYKYWHSTTIGYLNYGFYRWSDIVEFSSYKSFFGIYDIFLLIFGNIFIQIELIIAKFISIETPIINYLSNANLFRYSESAGFAFNFLTFNYDFYAQRLGIFIGYIRFLLDTIILCIPIILFKNSKYKYYYIISLICLYSTSLYKFPFGTYFSTITNFLFLILIIRAGAISSKIKLN